ncbi:protein bric-a-brac 1-like [Penaeus chinensis]|uniref:protein bric-a-brac 1-like n=1 Tax=Penaeus chinensis TaxID=139456 RepID=UPI001FB6CD0A|nr:protein bric-a-brac 1-like [Penaeus chinensis]
MLAKRKVIEEGDPSAKKRKHKTISMLEKVELLQKLESGTAVRSLCELYGISSSTVYDLKKQKEQIFSYFADNIGQKSLEKRKSLRRGKSTELDTTLLQWFKQRRSEGTSISGEMLMTRAKVLHRELNLDYSCEYSQGWLQRFKDRYGISLHGVSGEIGPGETEASAVDECAQLDDIEKLSPGQICNTERIPGQDDEASVVGEISHITNSSMEESSTIPEPTEEDVSLASHVHHSSILKTLFDDSTFADVTLTAEGHLIRAHKAVLSAMSPYFREVLQANPCQHPIIIMPLDVQYENLQGIISYIYNGQITLPSEKLASLLKTAKALQISGLASVDIIDVRNEDDKTPFLKTVKIQSEMEHPNKSGVSGRSSSATNRRKKARLISTAPSIVSKESLDKRARNEDFLKKRPTNIFSVKEITIPTQIQNKSSQLRESDNSVFQVIPSSNMSSENNVCEKQKEELEELQELHDSEDNSLLQAERHSAQQNGSNLTETIYVKEEPLF